MVYMAFKIEPMILGVVFLFLGVYLVGQVATSLYTPSNDAMDDLNDTMTAAGYDDEGDMVIRGWSFVQLGIGLAVLGAGIGFVIASIRNALKG